MAPSHFKHRFKRFFYKFNRWWHLQVKLIPECNDSETMLVISCRMFWIKSFFESGADFLWFSKFQSPAIWVPYYLSTDFEQFLYIFNSRWHRQVELIDYLVQGFGDQAEKIPESIRILHVCLWVTFLWVNEVREFHCVANEEHWCVVAHHVPISFFRVKFDWKSTRVPSCVREARFTCHSRPSPENLRLLANFA